ncbi:MAG: DNA helicase UvrD [Deltaproteobacteria bacterium]|nr:MAG: DNA helicase UvrD [Deltaproteobacteria bacterium]
MDKIYHNECGINEGPSLDFPLEDLNSAQYQAVTTTEGPVLVIAGAGSGKTRTLVYRLAHLLSGGAAPESVLLLTFTRKAAQEMLWRAGTLLNDSCKKVVGGTFHGVANKLLRRYGSHLGFSSNFSIIDRSDAEGIINLLKSSLGFGGRDKQFPTKRVIFNIISGSINKSIELEDLIYEQYAHLEEHAEEIAVIRKNYNEFKFDHGLMDYDDLLVNWKRLLAENSEARAEISSKFKYIMVDEYQDTNLIQADIIRLMACTHDNVMVVGDDSQSIYSFRGADFYNIMRFPKIFAHTTTIKLEENYRSTQPILSLTNDIIRNAAEKYAKILYTSIEGEEKPVLYAAKDDREEAAFICNKIKEMCDSGMNIGEIAVLFRSGFHSYKLEMELASAGIDFDKRGGLKLTESAHMKDVLSFLRVLENPLDNLSWGRILLQLDKVGPKTAQKITRTIIASPDPFASLSSYPAGKAWQAGLKKLSRFFDQLRGKKSSPAILFDLVLDYYRPFFEQIYRDDYPKRQKDLEQLRIIISDYDDLQSFIDDTALDPPESSTALSPMEEKLVLSTIHSAKGLEWDAVFIMGLADGRFPHVSAKMSEQMEEERRLLYVAATRARKILYFTYPREVMTPDRQFRRVGMSPFLSELKPGLFERLETGLPNQSTAKISGSFTARRKEKLSLADFSVGSKVQHPFFGRGEVQKIVQPHTVEISFDRHGIKPLHIGYAKLRIIHK